jgi:diadenylate cyclase
MEFLRFGILDAIDIAVIALLVYYFLRFIRGTRAIQMLIGLIFIFLVGFVASFFRLSTLAWIMEGFKAIWIIAFVILFQPELRNALTGLGKTRFARIFVRGEKQLIDELVESAIMLSDRGVGGIIAIEKDVSLKSYIDTGTKIEAKVSADLISTIFTPYSPLHDGAVIIENDTIVAAGCILPLSDNPDLDHSIGTRHRSALGLSEETDALCVVVSEETRKISLAMNGKFLGNISREKLKKELEKAIG